MISIFFWPEHINKNGDLNAVLIIDNSLVHSIDVSKLFTCLIIKVLPPNVKNKNQPSDMGMIAALKVGYKSLFLRNFLEIFDSLCGYK